MILSSWGITGIQGDTNQTTSTSCLSRMNDESEGRTLSQEISCTVLFLIMSLLNPMNGWCSNIKGK